MTPHRYTELFFLTKPQRLARGTVPCFECRRADYNRFQERWRESIRTPDDADSMDAVLHNERLDGKKKRTYIAALRALPDGTYVAIDGEPYLLLDSMLQQWSDGGYVAKRRHDPHHLVEVLTPESVVKVFQTGYRPMVHASAR